jgi:deoxyribonuclease-4
MAAMKLGAASYTYLWVCPLEEAIDRIARLGLRDLEIMTSSPHLAPLEFGAYERQRLRRKLDDAQVRLVALNPTYLDLNLASMNSSIRRASVAEIQANLQLAHDLRAELVVVMPGRRHPLIPAPFEEVWEVAVDSVGQCVRTAGDLGIKCGIESGPSLFVQRVSEAIRMLKEFDSRGCGLVYDVANTQMVESPVQGLIEAVPHMIHLHLSDTRKNAWGHLPIGQGEIDFAAITAELKKHSYKGAAILETIDQQDPDGGFRRSLEALAPLGWIT